MTERRRVVRVDGGRVVERPDTLAGGEPLGIRGAGRAVSVTMRTPGPGPHLAPGFPPPRGTPDPAPAPPLGSLPPEGVAPPPSAARAATGGGERVADVTTPAPAAATAAARRFYTSSSCGLCGKESIDAVRTRSPYDV